jgi:hypothetical protein
MESQPSSCKYLSIPSISHLCSLQFFALCLYAEQQQDVLMLFKYRISRVKQTLIYNVKNVLKGLPRIETMNIYWDGLLDTFQVSKLGERKVRMVGIDCLI